MEGDYPPNERPIWKCSDCHGHSHYQRRKTPWDQQRNIFHSIVKCIKCGREDLQYLVEDKESNHFMYLMQNYRAIPYEDDHIPV